MQEALPLLHAGSGLLDEHDAINDEQARAQAAHLPTQQAHEPLQPFLFQGRVATEIVKRLTNRRGGVKRQGAQVRQHATIRLGQQGEIECTSASSDMLKTELVAQDGVACPSWSHEDVAAPSEEPPLQ